MEKQNQVESLIIEFDDTMSEEDQKLYLTLFSQAAKEVTGKDLEYSELLEDLKDS